MPKFIVDANFNLFESQRCASLCSTSFGLSELPQSDELQFVDCACRAQPLRHHWNFHDSRPRCSAIPADACSTPFGVIGISTFRAAAQGTDPEVLNAFRHHWNFHCAGRNPLVYCMLQADFRASLRFALSTCFLTADSPSLRVTISKESDT